MFSALRGLEATLRKVLRKQQIGRGRLHELIESGLKLRWSRGGGRILDEGTAHLLHVLRVTRNASAHVGDEANDGWRQITSLALLHARRLWRSAQQGRRRIETGSTQRRKVTTDQPRLT